MNRSASFRRALPFLAIVILAVLTAGCVLPGAPAKKVSSTVRVVDWILQRNDRYEAMTQDELEKLSDQQLLVALNDRLLSQTEQSEDDYLSLNHEQQVFYCIIWYEAEVNNGGLCQFFVNSSREIAPRISEMLGEIGAEEHRALFEGFIRKNGIDVDDLSSFIIYDLSEYSAQTKRYPFDDFDYAFYRLEPLDTYLIAYARANLEKLAQNTGIAETGNPLSVKG